MRILLGLILIWLVIDDVQWAFRPTSNLYDAGSFILSGRAYNAGLNPYDTPEELLGQGQTFPTHSPNLNPPITVYPFSLIARFNADDVRNAIRGISLWLYVVIAGGLVAHYRRNVLYLLWALCLGGFWHLIELGQIYVLLLGLVAVAWLLLEKGKNAGIPLGLLVAVKPHFILWPVILYLNGDKRTAITAAGVAALFYTLPLLIDGPQIYGQWIGALRDFGNIPGLANSSLIGVGDRIGVIPLAWLATLVLGVWALRYRGSLLEVSSLAITATLLIGPITWPGYTVLLLPVLLWRWHWATAVLLVFPIEDAIFRQDLVASVYAGALLLHLQWPQIGDPEVGVGRNSSRPTTVLKSG